jgi:hypothetical protein
MNAPTILPRHPLDHPGVVKIALGQNASDALATLGPCLVVATMADSTAPPEAQGRMILLCLPISKQAADDAYRVARGTHRASKIKTPTAKP